MKLPVIAAGACVGLGLWVVLTDLASTVAAPRPAAASIRRSSRTQDRSENSPAAASNPEWSAIRRINMLAVTDPEDALTKAEAEKNPGLRLTMLAAAGDEIGRHDPGRAVSLSNDLPDYEARRVYLEAVVRTISQRDPALANSLAETLPAGPLRDALQRVVAIEWAQEDPPAAACFLAERMSGGEAQDQAALTVAVRWAHSDPAAVKRWEILLPESDLKELISSAIISVAPEAAE